MAKGQAERLMPFLEACLAEAGLRWADLDALGVGTGPGNFTGIRIAVAAARGLALGLGKPAYGIDRFTVLADGQQRPIAALVPAPRGQVYLRLFSADGAEAPQLVPEGTPPGAPLAPDLDAATSLSRIAAITAQRLADGLPAERPAPLYVRGAEAAPPRDPAPVLLP